MPATKSTFRVTLTILISRILGYIRDAVMASALGTGPLNEAFIAAFKLTNLFRSFFAEGALSAAIVPTFSQLISSHGRKYTGVIATHIFSLLLIVISLFSIFILYNMESIINITSPGFKGKQYLLDLTVNLSYIIFPYLILISIAAFYGSFLQSYGIFIPYAATSIILNIVLISAPFLGKYFSVTTAAHALAYGVLLSGILEVIWMQYWVNRKGLKVYIRMPMLSPKIKKIGKKIIPGIVGSSVTQINVWVDMIILSFFSGGISYLYFADRIVQLPLALFSTAASITLLPFLSKKYSDVNVKNNAFNKTIRVVLCFTIASTAGILAVNSEIITILFARGEFGVKSVIGTVAALNMLCVGLPAFAMMKIYSSVFYAHNDTKTPVKIAIVGLILNIIGSITFVQIFGHAGVPLASSISAWVNFIILFTIVRKRYGVEINISPKTSLDITKYIIGSILMYFLILFLKKQLFFIDNIGILLGIYICSAILTYFVILFILRCSILREFR